MFRSTIEVHLNDVVYGVIVPSKPSISSLTIDIRSPIVLPAPKDLEYPKFYPIKVAVYECVYQIHPFVHQKKWTRQLAREQDGTSASYGVGVLLTNSANGPAVRLWWTREAYQDVVVKHGTVELFFAHCPLFYMCTVMNMDHVSLEHLHSLMHQEPDQKQWPSALTEYCRGIRRMYGVDEWGVYMGMIRTGYNRLKTFLERVEARLAKRAHLIQIGKHCLPVSDVWQIVMDYVWRDDQCATMVTVRDPTNGKDIDPLESIDPLLTRDVPLCDTESLESIDPPLVSHEPLGNSKKRKTPPDMVAISPMDDAMSDTDRTTKER